MDTEGNIFNFVMNDKCAAGTGAGDDDPVICFKQHQTVCPCSF
ncbi:MAG: hypothetical protein R6U40_08500 [Desulfobacterales bacterium]